LAIWKDNLQAVRTPLAILAVCVGLSFVSGMVVGEKAREIKAKMYSAQEIQTNTELRDRFHRIHRVSTALNVAILLLLLVYAGYLPTVIKPQ
jgi:gamma-glutamyl-gamma-aminobutyrate hydrolase PuuD